MMQQVVSHQAVYVQLLRRGIVEMCGVCVCVVVMQHLKLGVRMHLCSKKHIVSLSLSLSLFHTHTDTHTHTHHSVLD